MALNSSDILYDEPVITSGHRVLVFTVARKDPLILRNNKRISIEQRIGRNTQKGKGGRVYADKSTHSGAYPLYQRSIPRLERQVIRKLVIRLLRTNTLRYQHYTDSKQRCFRVTRGAEEAIHVEGSRFWESLTLLTKQLFLRNSLSLCTIVDDQQTITTAEWKG